MEFDFSNYLYIVRKVDDELHARCPFHDDSRPSFSANVKTGLWRCHAGCGDGDFIHFTQMINSGRRVRIYTNKNFQVNGRSEDEKFRKVATYQYMNGEGSYHLRITRLESSSGAKRFFQEHLDAYGHWVKGGATTSVLPYLIQEWIGREHPVVFFVEGEKCAEFLQSKGFKATTTPGGAGKWKPHYADHFYGKQIVILPDGDLVGLKFAHEIQSTLYLKNISASIIFLPGLGDGEDVVDWFSQGGTVEVFRKLTSVS